MARKGEAGGVWMTEAELALVRILEAAVAALRERAEQADRAWEAECERANRAEQRVETAEAGRDAERIRADTLQAERDQASNAAAALRRADVGRRQAFVLTRLLAAWRGE
jgi:hypothetical protein